MNKLQIRDETGTIYEGTEIEVKMVWSLMVSAMDHSDNPQVYVKGDYIDIEGDIELIEVHKVKSKPEYDDRTQAEIDRDDKDTALEEKRDAKKDDK